MFFTNLFKTFFVGVRLDSLCQFCVHESTDVVVNLVFIKLLLSQFSRFLEIVTAGVVLYIYRTCLNTQIKTWWIWTSWRVLNWRQRSQRRFVLILFHQSLGRPSIMHRESLKFLRQSPFARTCDVCDPFFALGLQFLHHVVVPHFPIFTLDHLHLFSSI